MTSLKDYASSCYDIDSKIFNNVNDLMAMIDLMIGAFTANCYEVDSDSIVYVACMMLDKARAIKEAAANLESLKNEMLKDACNEALKESYKSEISGGTES